MTRLNMTVPAYIDADHIPDEPAEAVVWLGDLAYGGCRAGTYMPAMEYYNATRVMDSHWRAILTDDTAGVGRMRDYHRPAHNRTVLSRQGGWTLYPQAEISLADEHWEEVGAAVADEMRSACGRGWPSRAGADTRRAYLEFCGRGWMRLGADWRYGDAGRELPARTVEAFPDAAATPHGPTERPQFVEHRAARRVTRHDLSAIADAAGAIACACLAARVELWAWQTMEALGVTPRSDRAVRAVTP